MVLSEIFNLSSVEGLYLKYLIEFYNKKVIEPYNKYFTSRDSKISVLLNDDFSKIKDGIDGEIININNMIDKLEISNLSKDELENISLHIDNLDSYLQYLSIKFNKKDQDSKIF
jgi:hypothetical protein